MNQTAIHVNDLSKQYHIGRLQEKRRRCVEPYAKLLAVPQRYLGSVYATS